MTTPTPPEGWQLSWETNLPRPGDPDYADWKRLAPLMVAYQQALIDATPVAGPVEPTPYRNGTEYVQPDWNPPPLDEEAGPGDRHEPDGPTWTAGARRRLSTHR